MQLQRKCKSEVEMSTILVVEDNKEIQYLMDARLKSYFNIIRVNDGLEALDTVYKNHIDLIITDIMLPNMSGYELIKKLRREENHVPVLVVTKKKSLKDKREAFESGADDYLITPVNYDEVLLRVNALLKRSGIVGEKKIVFGSVAISSLTYSATWGSELLLLSQKEFELLYILLSYPNIIFNKKQLIEYTKCYNSESAENTIHMNIKRLQNMFERCKDFEIISVGENGYKAEIKVGNRNKEI